MSSIKTILCSYLFLAAALSTTSQKASAQIGIGESTPRDEAILNVESSNKGVLIPRINLTDLSTLAPVDSNSGTGTESLLVYNTNIQTGKGFYYWNGVDKWIAIGKENTGLQFYSYDIAPTASPDLLNIFQNQKITKSGYFSGDCNVTPDQFPSHILKPGIDNEGFVIKLVGYYTVKNSGIFNYSVSSSNGSRIYVDGALIHDKWNNTPSTITGSVELHTGKYKFEFIYYGCTGEQSFCFQWGANPDGLPVGTIKAAQFTID